MKPVRAYTSVGNHVYVGSFRMGNIRALVNIVFGKDTVNV